MNVSGMDRRPPPSPYRQERPSPWELIRTGFWLALGFMAASVVVTVVIVVGALMLSIALRQMGETS